MRVSGGRCSSASHLVELGPEGPVPQVPDRGVEVRDDQQRPGPPVVQRRGLLRTLLPGGAPGYPPASRAAAPGRSGGGAQVRGEVVGQLVDGGADVLLLVVQVDVAGALDPVDLRGAGGAAVGFQSHPRGDGVLAEDLQHRARADQRDGVEDVAGGHHVDALPGEELRGALVVAALAAVVLPAFDTVPSAELAGLLRGLGEHGHHPGVLVAGGGGTRLGGGVQQGLEDGRGLGAVGAVAELSGGFCGGHRGDGLDAVVACGGGQRVAAGGADAQNADAVGVDLDPGDERGDSGLEVLHALGGVLKTARDAAGLPLVGRVEGEGDEAAVGHLLRVQARGLLLHTRAGVTDDQRRARAGRRGVREVEVRLRHLDQPRPIRPAPDGPDRRARQPVPRRPPHSHPREQRAASGLSARVTARPHGRRRLRRPWPAPVGARTTQHREELDPAGCPFLTRTTGDPRDHDDRSRFATGPDMLLDGRDTAAGPGTGTSRGGMDRPDACATCGAATPRGRAAGRGRASRWASPVARRTS
ncbi:hypothetical protein SCOCK_140210 [Actinacidiphila cocklensis]|uniref:Uncharacterized protein n=1 Tax=Actinacidiphila cocklensis TaxID=887465 RepID=A0A9W4E3E9_9ACTN|nr:hypothetical protein SCOCK_140210 [Actinacidiphila cocklensis]